MGWLTFAHVALAGLLVPFALLSFATAIYPGIDEWTDMSVLAPAVQLAVLGAWLPPLITPFLSFRFVRRSAENLERFWVIPVIGMVASVVLHLLPYLFFDAPTAQVVARRQLPRRVDAVAAVIASHSRRVVR